MANVVEAHKRLVKALKTVLPYLEKEERLAPNKKLADAIEILKEVLETERR